MATRDQMLAEALREVKDGMVGFGVKLDNFMREVNDFKVDVAANREFSLFKEKYAEEMATVKTQVKIYAGIAAAIGTIVGGVVAKLVIH